MVVKKATIKPKYEEPTQMLVPEEDQEEDSDMEGGPMPRSHVRDIKPDDAIQEKKEAD